MTEGSMAAFTSYVAPAAESGPAAASPNLQSLMEYGGEISEQFRAELERGPLPIDPNVAPDLFIAQEIQSGMRHFSLLELQFEFIGKGLQLANRNVQVLYQQQG